MRDTTAIAGPAYWYHKRNTDGFHDGFMEHKLLNSLEIRQNGL